MRVAIPVWDEKISPVLDTATRLWVVDLEDEGLASRFEIFIEEQDLPTRCLRIVGSGVDTLICGAVSRPFLNMLESSGVTIIPGIVGHKDDVLNAYVKGTLFDSKFQMPGYDNFRSAERNTSKGTNERPRRKNRRIRTSEAGIEEAE